MKLAKSIKKSLTFLLFLGLLVALVAWSNPDNIAYPEFEHLHFRMSYNHQGTELNFGAKEYQEEYNKDQCGGGLTKTPLHFHDNENHIVHIHWRNITGGQVLKYYGLNKVDWFDNYIGIRARDDNKKISLSLVPIHAQLIPELKENDKLWVYTGNAEKYENRDFKDFISKDLETFFNKKSEVRKGLEEQSFLPMFNAIAHDVPKAEGESESNKNITNQTEEELKTLNNWIGDLVIFAQSDQPNKELIQQRFNNLSKLKSSSCGG
ncbi:MAG: hypothetical protein ACRCXZ_04575 [Patescibacteria group bacterium]